MHFPARKITSVLALAASATLLAVAPAVASAASAGGAAAPSTTATAPSAHHVRSTAIATWFGPGFYGQKTACGQTLTPAVVGVANRTLPCGTLVRVSYAGHSLTVPVLDRGPYSNIGADWDLTSGAARALGISDTVRIHARVVGSAPNTPSLGAPTLPPSTPVSGGSVAGGAVAG
jgi:rare lipoprotein A (peptidoglycan hydrolase)